MQVPSEGVAWLNGPVEFHLELLSMLNWIELKRCSQGLKSLAARVFFVAANAAGNDILCLRVLDQGGQQVR